ncbi:MAG TPA: threonine/serine dehydratase [Beijerinckiaceae bacterium]|jgi:threonine dehydratase
MTIDIASIRRAAERLSGRIVRTPLLNSAMLDELAGCRVFVKAEPLQKTGSFKLRGALSKILSVPEDKRRSGFVAFSSGNHGQAVAAGAKAVGAPSVIVMPKDAPAIKIESCRWWGAEVVLFDRQSDDREAIGRRIETERGMTLVRPFDDPEVMSGQGTMGLEIVEQLREVGAVPDALLVNCSGGGLAAGVTTAVRDAFPETAFYTVEPAGFDKMARSLASGEPQRNERLTGSIMDALMAQVPGRLTLAQLRANGAKGLSATDDEALAAMAAAFRTLKLVVEPGGAAALGALLAGKADLRGGTVVVVASGGNVDPAMFSRALERRPGEAARAA